MSFLDSLKVIEDRFLAAVQHAAISRLLTAGVIGAVVLDKVRPDLQWPRYVIEAGAAVGIYGSTRRRE